LIHAEFKTQGIDFDTKEVILKPQIIQYNDRKDKFYYKYLREHQDGKMHKVNRWKVPKPSQELIDKYEAKKREFTDKLNAEISAQLVEKEQKAIKREYKCQDCEYTWSPRGKSASRCPKCSKNRIIELTPPHIEDVRHIEAAAI
jgi:predicted Zn-ribbon and HTH transcriptional regulator